MFKLRENQKTVQTRRRRSRSVKEGTDSGDKATSVSASKTSKKEHPNSPVRLKAGKLFRPTWASVARKSRAVALALAIAAKNFIVATAGILWGLCRPHVQGLAFALADTFNACCPPFWQIDIKKPFSRRHEHDIPPATAVQASGTLCALDEGAAFETERSLLTSFVPTKGRPSVPSSRTVPSLISWPSSSTTVEAVQSALQQVNYKHQLTQELSVEGHRSLASKGMTLHPECAHNMKKTLDTTAVNHQLRTGRCPSSPVGSPTGARAAAATLHAIDDVDAAVTTTRAEVSGGASPFQHAFPSFAALSSMSRAQHATSHISRMKSADDLATVSVMDDHFFERGTRAFLCACVYTCVAKYMRA